MPERTKSKTVRTVRDVAIVDEIKHEKTGLYRTAAEILADYAREGRHVVRPVAHEDEDGKPMVTTQGGRYAIVERGSGERVTWGSSLANFLERAETGTCFYVSEPSALADHGLFEIKTARYAAPTPANCEKLEYRGAEGPHVVFHEVGNDKKVYVLPLDRCFVWGFPIQED